MHGVLCRMRSIVEAHLNQRWRQHSIKPTHWSDGYPKTSFRRPLVSHPTTPLATSHLLVLASLTLYKQSHGLFLSPQPTPLHLLTRFSCLFHTWTHPNGSILHPHDLIEPHFVLTQNRKEEHSQSSALSSTSSSDHHHHCSPLRSSSSAHCTFVLMDNSYMPFFSTATATNTTSNVGCSPNSDFSFEPTSSQFQHPSQLLPPYQSLQLPYRHPMEQEAPMYPCFDFGVWKEQERRNMDPYRTKLARINRKLARQRSLMSSQRNATPGASTQVDARRLMINYGANSDMRQSNDTKKDLYKFITPDKKRLRVLLRKELKNSDVGSLGRIVLPKRETEANLPTLYDKEGIQVTMKDVYSNNEWTLKYKFWINNKSRMYVLENTGDFVKQNGLRIGDSLTLYEDESKNLYFSISKVATVAVESSGNQQQYYNTLNYNSSNSHIYVASKDDEEASLELLIEQLKHKEPEEPNDFIMTLPMDAANNSHRILHDSQMQTSATSLGGMARSVDDISINFDDCYGGLDMLPDVNHYNFSL